MAARTNLQIHGLSAMTWSRLTLAALIVLAALALTGSPDEIWNSAQWDEAGSVAAARFALDVIAPGRRLVGFVPELVVATAPAPLVGYDAPRAPPVA
jgi:hypothetical protein